MPQSATLPTSGGGGMGGLGSLPTPVKIGLIGGGAGLAFFLWRRATSGGGASGGQLVSGDSTTYGIPNTAVMLGSLQQEMLDLKGQQGADTANLSDLLSGGFSNLGYMMDAQTGTIQGSLTDLQSAIINNQNANTKSILDSLSARSDLLTKLIQDNSGAEAAAFKAFQDSTAAGLGAISAQQNAEMAAIGALGQNVSVQQQAIIGQIQTLQGQTTKLQSSVNQTGAFLGWQWYQIPNRYTAYINPGVNPPGWTDPYTGASS